MKRQIKKITKKIGLLSLIGVLGITTLAACGKDNSSNSKSNNSDNPEKSTSTRTIKVVTGGAPKPYIWQNEDGSFNGYDIAVFNAIAEKLPQYKFEYELTSDLFTSVDAGYAQVIVQHLGSNDERREKYLFSYPYYFAEHGLVVAEDADWYTTFDDLAGHTTETNSGSFNSILYEKYNEEHPDSKIKFTYTESDESLLHVADGSIDFSFFDYISLKQQIEEKGLTGVKLLEVNNDDIPQANVGYTYFLTSTEEQQLHDDIDNALLELISDGTLAKLAEEYLGGAQFAPTVEAAKENH
jgi:polar amino acid transport system substrate-binding protein